MRRNILILALLMAMTAALAGGHLATRAGAEPGTLLAVNGGASVGIDIDALPFERVQGAIVNGKGEERQIDAEGVPLRAVLEAAGMEAPEGVRVVAADEYSAGISAEELAEANKVWLIREAESLRLIVFGDENSKRAVRDVERIEVQ